MLAKGVGQGSGAPQKHPAVPEIISCGHKRSRLFRVGLLGETADVEGLASEKTASLNISVAGFGAIRADADHYNILTRRRDLYSSFDSRAIVLFVRNHMIGGKHSNHRVGIFAQKKEGGETDSRRGVSSQWLGEHLHFG